MDHIISGSFQDQKGDVNSVGYIGQAICWMTNDGRLAQTLADQRDGGSGEWIREASFAGGLDRFGAIFQPNLVTAVLKVIKRNVLDQQVISAVELQSGGPTAELPELWNQPDCKEYWDDVNGGFLDPRLGARSTASGAGLDQEGTSI